MSISDLAQAEQILATYRPAVKEFLGKDITLARMAPLMEALDNPQCKLKIIHVAGTSGKTSTAYYVANMLQLTGNTVGLTTSPHVNSILERLQINLKPVDEQVFCDVLSEVIQKTKNVDPQPTYYELLIAMVYYYFAKVGVDFAVVETGLGGLLDGTNIAQNPDKLCVITDIGLDHTKVLGDTIPEIAAQKAGIIHAENRVIMFKQSPDVMQVFRTRCEEVGATLASVKPDIVKDFAFSPSLPMYQRRNWALAWSAYQYLANVYELPIIDTSLLGPSRDVFIPGRMEILSHEGKTLVLDGAHNTQKMTAFAQSFTALYPAEKPCILLSVRDKKDFTDLIQQLFPLASRLILTSFHVSQDIEHKNAHLDEIMQYCHANGFDDVTIENNQHTAFRVLMNDPSNVKIITGSFYLIQQIKQRENL